MLSGVNNVAYMTAPAAKDSVKSKGSFKHTGVRKLTDQSFKSGALLKTPTARSMKASTPRNAPNSQSLLNAQAMLSPT